MEPHAASVKCISQHLLLQKGNHVAERQCWAAGTDGVRALQTGLGDPHKSIATVLEALGVGRGC